MNTHILDDYFVHEHAPRLKYITKQTVGENWIDRPIHTHTETAELLIIGDGTGIYNLDTVNYELHKGDLVLSNPGTPHEIRTIPGESLSLYSYGFTDFLQIGLPKNHLLADEQIPIRNNPDQFPLLLSISDYLFQNLDKGERNSVFSSLLVSLLVMALETPVKKTVQLESIDSDQIVAQRTKEYIDEHFLDALTLEDLSAALSYSAPYISHAFKEIMGYSPIQYMTRCRIGMAQTLLIETDYSATRIATMAGYNNTNYFTTVFTKMVGSTPIQYRKEYLKSINKNA